MAGDWIKFELTTLDKPEVCQIADEANIDSDAVVGKLLRVWGWFDQQTSEGNAPSVSKRLLDRLVGVTGFCDLMRKVGWMVEDDGVISIPNFERHNGKTAKNRLLTAKRVANHKAANGKGNARSVSDALPREDVEKREKEQEPRAGSAAPQHQAEANPETDQAKPRASRLPKDWALPEDWAAWALAERPEFTEQQVRAIGATFADFWHAKAGKDACKLDWLATWRNWIRNQKAHGGNVRQLPSRHVGLNDQDYSRDLEANGDGTYRF
ncbi:hypothetical protein [Pseudomonas oryzihabitans]|uniref:hypothetical protein n=1 Tax=Pseudomonas oryzihabitans TaxID=47885 RepID=UPI000A7FCD4D|nr:hypothetical protein [Pseudomonas oryzihabitans]